MSVLVRQEDEVLRLTFTDPTFSAAMAADLLRELQRTDVNCFLIDGVDPMFCSGGSSDLPVEVFQFREWITKPVVCAVQGAALGPGLALVANAHVAVAAQGTSFGCTEIRTGGWPIGFHAIRNAIGERRATELAMSGRVFGSPEALQMGLVHEIAPAFEYDDRAETIAQHLASQPLKGRLPPKGREP
jgi:enoyl-CoA hydratase/carnithine racemase